MPLYDFRCPSCEHIEQDVFKRMHTPIPDCPKCGAGMLNHSAPSVKRVWDSDALHEHVADEPMRFRSERELKYYCRENGRIANFAEGGI